MKHAFILAGIGCMTVTAFAQKKSPDTLFLLREVSPDDYHAIYIDTTGRSAAYDAVADFRIDKFDRESYQASLDYLREHGLKLTPVNISGLPHKWVMIQSYKGKWYAYSPSDFCFHYKMDIRNNAVVEYTVEGPVAHKISSFRKRNDGSYSLEIRGLSTHKTTLTIYMIDREKGIALFRSETSGAGTTYRVMVDASRIRNLPVIVNYSRNNRAEELVFDEIDYPALVSRLSAAFLRRK